VEAGPHAGLSFRDLGRQVLETAKAQVEVLQNRAHEVHPSSLSTDWPVAKRPLAPLQAECRTPLYELNFLEDLWGFDSPQMAANSRHRRQFVLIQADVECSWPARKASWTFPNTLERDLGCWADPFGKILQKLDEESLS